jgi:hypothetical protein
MSTRFKVTSVDSTATADRKRWIEHRIEELAQIFAGGVGGFAV